MNSEKVESLLGRVNELLLILAKTGLRDVLATELDEPKKRKLYELTGKGLPVKELTKKVGMSTGAISKVWQTWEELGLLTKRNGKYWRSLE